MLRGRGPQSVLAAIALLALVVRWPIASHDVEHYIGPDEGEVVENVLEMMKAGDLDHRHPGYPGLHFYLQLLPATAHLLHARALGRGDSIPELPRSGFYLAARRLTLVFGALTVLATAWCGRLFLGPWAAVLAGALVALSPLQFRESAVVNPDLALTLAVTVALALALRVVGGSGRTTAGFLAAGAAVGLSFAVKYTGALAAAPYALAWLLGTEPRRHAGRALAGALAGGVAFAATSPYTVADLGSLWAGLAMHAGYYGAAETNGAWEILRALFPRGIGVVGSVAALVGIVRAATSPDRTRLVVLAFPVSYLLVFVSFDRAFPRHALVLLPHLALFAAETAERLVRVPPVRTARVALAGAVSVLLVMGPLVASTELRLRTARATPADRAAAWAERELPEGSRVLQDQYTPRLDPERFRVHRLGVEENVFVGNYDWVFRSGYPPGLPTAGLREVRTFERGGALGDSIVLYQVPDRASLMEPILAADDAAVLGAGELAYFGEGWHPPRPGAFETSRLSRGTESEIFFVLDSAPGHALEAVLVAGAPVRDFSPRVELELNGAAWTVVTLDASEHQTRSLSLPPELLRAGLNRLLLRHRKTVRLDRRHRDTAIRLFRIELGR